MVRLWWLKNQKVLFADRRRGPREQGVRSRAENIARLS
jgi:hypothetical protein